MCTSISCCGKQKKSQKTAFRVSTSLFLLAQSYAVDLSNEPSPHRADASLGQSRLCEEKLLCRRERGDDLNLISRVSEFACPVGMMV